MSDESPNVEIPRLRWLTNICTLVGIAVALFAAVLWITIIQPGLNHRAAVRSLGSMGAFTEYRFSKGPRSSTPALPGPAWLWKFVDPLLILRVQEVRYYGMDRSHSHVNDDTIMPLLAKLSDVRHIALYGTDVTNRGLKDLSHLQNLKFLTVSESKLRDESLDALSPLKLEWLSLRRTWVGDVAIASLKDMTSLEHLDLERTRVSDRGLKSLEGLYNLRSLDLGRTKVTAAGAEELRKKLPKCEIRWEPLNPPATVR